MPIHIEHVVTEVYTEAEEAGEGEPVDRRWGEQLKTEACLKATERHHLRLSAEAFDD